MCRSRSEDTVVPAGVIGRGTEVGDGPRQLLGRYPVNDSFGCEHPPQVRSGRAARCVLVAAALGFLLAGGCSRGNDGHAMNPEAVTPAGPAGRQSTVPQSPGAAASGADSGVASGNPVTRDAGSAEMANDAGSVVMANDAGSVMMANDAGSVVMASGAGSVAAAGNASAGRGGAAGADERDAMTGLDSVPALFVTNWLSNDLSAYSVGTDGVLTAAPSSPLDAGAGSAPFGVAVSPDRARRYVSNSATDSVSVFAVLDDGALTPVEGPVPTGGGTPWGIAVSPNGRYVYAANIKSNNVTVFAVSDAGMLTAVDGSPFATGLGARSVVVTPDGNYVYVTNTGPLGPFGNDCQAACPAANTVSAYAVQSDGSLKELDGSPYPAGDGAHGASITPDGRHLYVANLLGGTLSAYTVGADGALTPTADSPVQVPGHSVAISRDGRYLYASDPGGSVSAHAISSDGTLREVPGSPFPTIDGGIMSTFALAVTPDGLYLYAENFSLDLSTIVGFSIAADGSLTPVAGSPFRAGLGSIGMAITPGGP